MLCIDKDGDEFYCSQINCDGKICNVLSEISSAMDSCFWSNTTEMYNIQLVTQNENNETFLISDFLLYMLKLHHSNACYIFLAVVLECNTNK